MLRSAPLRAITATRFIAAFLLVGLVAAPLLASPSLEGDGLLRTKSAYSVAETAERLRADVEAKGIQFFQAIDQAALAAEAGIELRPATLLIFGNPPLGALFLTSNPEAGLDWPVRVQVYEAEDGAVYAAYQDWDWVAARYGITDRTEEFATATGVVMSIMASIMTSIADCDVVEDCTE